jgi:hypothetical protein
MRGKHAASDARVEHGLMPVSMHSHARLPAHTAFQSSEAKYPRLWLDIDREPSS